MCGVKYPRKVKTFVTLVNSATNPADGKGPGRSTVTAKRLTTGLADDAIPGEPDAGVTSVASTAPTGA
ncbi:hypothetical protein MPRM_11610 [Mycobacterium parmense]|uniref:Uncharacterized protein n=1 Tax=Mycobacterium parmense TaxID=185642 RepID=A0A7I7YQ45_9MYCO|nr:hypothetical protein MPRM_11610 [Mycobacterium parmense]